MMRAAVGKNKTCRCLQLLCGVVVFPVLLSLLLGCGGRPTVVLFMEAYWEEFFNASREELRELVKSHGFQHKIVSTSGEYDGYEWASLETPLQENRASIAVLSPFMKPLAVELAGRNPGVTFVLLAEAGRQTGAGPTNLVTTTFDRVPVFREAGEAVGRMLLELRERRTADRESEQRAAVIYTREGLYADAETEAFRQGFARAADEALLFTRHLDDDADAIKARATMEEAKNRNAAFTLLHLQKLLPTCMDFLSIEGGWAVIADWERSFAYRDSVVMSVEEDYLDAIGQALRDAAQGDKTAKAIAGRVYLSVNPRYFEGMSVSEAEKAATGRGNGG